MKFRIILEMDTKNVVDGMSAQEAAGIAVLAFQGIFQVADIPVKGVQIEMQWMKWGRAGKQLWESKPVRWEKIGSDGLDSCVARPDSYMVDLSSVETEPASPYKLHGYTFDDCDRAK